MFRLNREPRARVLARAAAWLLCLACAVPALGAEFELYDVDGKRQRLSDYRGRWVVVNFWATWCPPCLEEIPQLSALHADHLDGDVTVLGVNFEEIELDPLRRFVAEWKISYPVLRVGEQPLVPFEPLVGLPSTFLVDPSGKLVVRHTGPITRDALEALLREHRAEFTRRAESE